MAAEMVEADGSPAYWYDQVIDTHGAHERGRTALMSIHSIHSAASYTPRQQRTAVPLSMLQKPRSFLGTGGTLVFVADRSLLQHQPIK